MNTDMLIPSLLRMLVVMKRLFFIGCLECADSILTALHKVSHVILTA